MFPLGRSVPEYAPPNFTSPMPPNAGSAGHPVRETRKAAILKTRASLSFDGDEDEADHKCERAYSCQVRPEAPRQVGVALGKDPVAGGN